MKHGPFSRHLDVASITQGVESGLIGHALCQAVAKHLARLDGDDDCQVQPVLAGRHAGEVIHPCPDARIDVKSPIEDVLGDRARMPTIVVRGTKRPLRTPCRPSSCISRRTCSGLIQCPRARRAAPLAGAHNAAGSVGAPVSGSPEAVHPGSISTSR